MDASYFFLGRQVTDNTFGAQPGLGVYRPFVNVPNNNSPAVELVNTGPVTGTVNINTFSELWGGDINLRRKLICGPTYWLDGLVGYRHLELNEGITITENLIVNNNGTPGSIIVSDSFRTYNQFDGAQVGLAGEYRLGRRWSLFGTVKVAMGNVHQTVDMQGSTAFNIPPIPASVQPGGLLVQNSNIGRYSVDRFAVMPEVGIKIGWDLTERLRLYAGYDFMYLSSVIRPGDQIDTGLDPAQLPTAVGPGRVSTIGRPAVLFRATDFWAQGLNFGMMYKY
jgi:hypothetical protein